MNIIVIGSGGREHTIIRKLKENKDIATIYAIPGNGGISKDAICVDIDVMDVEKQIEFANEHDIDYVVVAPDNPLAAGSVDKFEEAGYKCFGPRANAAIIEASKAFSKDLMRKYNIPTAKYETFTEVDKALAYIDENEVPIVIKADGLALGKGVVIAMSKEEAKQAIHEMMEESKFGDAGSTIVIEEYLEGPEVSVLSFTDGKTLIPMVSSMDHKRAHDNDDGLNTGGMGAIAPNPFYTDEIAKESMDTIFMPTLKAMEKEGRPFKGCLYFSLMLTKDGPKVIEYNSRFGDPETQAVLPLLESDLLTVMKATTDGTLDKCEVKFSDKAACCVVVASDGYPEAFEKGNPITIDESVEQYVTVAGAKLVDGKLVNSGGRVLGVTAVEDTLEQAINKSYEYVEKVGFKNAYYRHDIGQRALKCLKED